MFYLAFLPVEIGGDLVSTAVPSIQVLRISWAL